MSWWPWGWSGVGVTVTVIAAIAALVIARGKQWELFFWTLIAVIIGVVGVATASLVAAKLAYDWEPYSIVTDAGKDGVTFLEPLKIGLTFAAGVGGAVALVVAYRKQHILERDDEGKRAQARDELEKQRILDEGLRAREAAAREVQRTLDEGERARGAVEREVQRTYRDRYGAAAAQLGADTATVRLAGVYAMANLADEWEAQRQQCVDVLCAYLRLPWVPAADPDHPLARLTVAVPIPEWAGGGSRSYAYPDQLGEVEVRKTILRVIGTHLRGPCDDAENAPREGPWSSLRIDFREAQLPDLDWAGAHIPARATFYGAIFIGDAWFLGARFIGEASFDHSRFTRRANFNGAHFAEDAGFSKASFAGDPDFMFAKFTKIAWFDGAAFIGGNVHFDKTEFADHARFREAAFAGNVSFCEAAFKGDAWFGEAVFKGDARFSRATFEANASFNKTTFARKARFEKVRVHGSAAFGDAAFIGEAVFAEAAIACDTSFKGATFAENAIFSRVSFTEMPNFAGASFAGDVSEEVRLFLTPIQLARLNDD